jgi:hypothetical protein
VQAFFITETSIMRKFLALFTPSAIEMAARELAEAKLSALREQTMAEYMAAEAVVHQTRADFNAKRITRLNAYLRENTQGDDRYHPNAFGAQHG